jgi:diguanylate cyclase (GGDEF)-like protein/PAS domain S-box-containing protein
MGIDHVQLGMPAGGESVRTAEEFYGGVLGLHAVPRPETMRDRGGCWFEGPCVKVHLGVEEPFRPTRDAHPGLMVDDLVGLIQRIRTAGSDLWLADDPRWVCTRDPFGNLIELTEASTPAPDVFRVMAEESIHPLALIDANGIVRWIGRSVERFFGYAPETLVGKTLDHLIAPESRQSASQAFANIDDVHQPTPWGGVGFPVDVRRDDGSVVTCELAALTRHRSGLPWYVIVIRQAGYERALDQTVEAMASGASLTEMLPRVVAAIEHMLPRTGVTLGHDWTGRQFELSSGATGLLVDEVDSPWAEALERGQDIFVDLAGLPGPVAERAAIEGYAGCWVHPVPVAEGALPRSAIILWPTHPGTPTVFTWRTVRRAGQLLRLTLQWDEGRRILEFAATHDALTGVVNRRVVRQRLEALADATANGTRGHTAVLYIDLDHFKPVNDELGHQVGDRVLAEVAERLRSALRPGDTVARVGGDEFVVLCERLGRHQDAERVASRLLDVIHRPIVAGDHIQQDVSLGASIGVAGMRYAEAGEALLGRAEAAMRAAKSSGRGRWVRG